MNAFTEFQKSGVSSAVSSGSGGGHHHQRTKSSVLQSFIGGHRRNKSNGSALMPSASTPTTGLGSGTSPDTGLGYNNAGGGLSDGYLRHQNALGESHGNQQDQHQTPRSPDKPSPRDQQQQQKSPTKSAFATISLKSLGVKDNSNKPSKSKDKKNPDSPTKPKKVKSSTNLVGFLTRPKSNKNLKQLASDEDAQQQRAAEEKNKENRTPPSSLTTNDYQPPPPIYAQFATQHFGDQQSATAGSPQQMVFPDPPFRRRNDSPMGRASTDDVFTRDVAVKPRPKSYHPYSTEHSSESRNSNSSHESNGKGSKKLTWGKERSSSRPNIKSGGVFSGLGQRAKSSASVATLEPFINPKEIDKHLEAMLDRRNIPENQRHKMRCLNKTIKMEFIRQDWAEAQQKLQRPGTNDSDGSVDGGAPVGGDRDDSQKKKHSRGRSFTLSRGANKVSSSPTKKKGESSIGRHFRTKSSDSVTSEHPPSAESPASSSNNAGIFAKIKSHQQQGPVDFVSYLRKVQKPEVVEVGKLHKLRLLLRNETVAWTEEFIRQGGMKEIVELLHRIMAVEWREEHEDALLHENLLCLKALCTTALAQQYLHSIHDTLFPALLHMIFDPEKKGPSEFTTRNIVTSVLLTYIECAPPMERLSRAQAVLRYLRDPEAKEEERPVSFVLEMRRERPYRMWCKEVVSVTKEVFWIFLHNLNIVALPSDKSSSPTNKDDTLDQQSMAAVSRSGAAPNAECNINTDANNSQFAYMARHFPRERPPVPAAPYVGGVEWDATNYLASHLDLMNAIIACTGPTPQHRNALRAELRISGWERCLGGSLRTCKEKFYGSVHDGLRTWVAAAAEDGWDVRDVRYGPPPESRSASPVKRVAACAGGGGGAHKKKEEAPPKLEMPELDLAIDGHGGNALAAHMRPNDPWLS